MPFRDRHIDPHLFEKALAERGFRSVSAFCRISGIPRSTMNSYLLGGRSIFSTGLRKICSKLQVDPIDLALEEGDTELERSTSFRKVKKACESLSTQNPGIAFVLFGSRSSSRHHSYSDWDIGISAGSQLIDSTTYLAIKRESADLFENFPYSISVVNLDNAPPSFLAGIRDKPIFIAGSRVSYHHFQGVLDGLKKAEPRSRGERAA